MASNPRSHTVQLGEVGVFHCWSRCVRRAWLCGMDPVSGNDYEYRRNWICQFEELLASLFAVEVGFHAEESNHIHLVVRIRPDVVETWSDEEVARRWLHITHLIKSKKGQLKEISEGQIAIEKSNPDRVTVLRSRLADPSWFMAALCEHIALRCNRDEGNSGHFLEDRYGCRHLADEGALLVRGIYVDLNQIRAGEALTSESSIHTSAHDRIKGRLERSSRGEVDLSKTPDGWLCELTLDENMNMDDPAWFRSVTARRASDLGLLPISLEEYLELLDASGRIVREGKRGAIPGELAPILERIGVQTEHWLEVITNFHTCFGNVVGTCQKLSQRAAANGRRWYRSRPKCAEVFG